MRVAKREPSFRKGLGELLRVTRDSIVVLTFDGPMLERYWLFEYVPELIAPERSRYIAMDELRQILEPPGRSVQITNVPVPEDCTDGIIEAFYARPERFLDASVRRSQSCWSFVEKSVEQRFVRQLRADLKSGSWDERFGALRMKASYDGSLRLVVSRPT